MGQAEDRGLGSSSVGKASGWYWVSAECEAMVCPGSKDSQQPPGLCKRGMAHRLREGIVPLHVVLLRPNLDNAFSFGVPIQQRHGHNEGNLGRWGWSTFPVRRG